MKQIFLISRSMDCFKSLNWAKVSMIIPNRMLIITMITIIWNVASNANFTKYL